MRQDLETIGVANPYALTEAVIGRKVDWRATLNPKGIVETALGMPFGRLIDPVSGSLLFPGLKTAAKGQLQKVTKGDLKADVTRRLDLHKAFRPVAPTAQLSPQMKTLIARPAPLAQQQLRDIILLITGVVASDGWTDQGAFFTDGAQEGDPVQGGLGDCYFIGALDAVAFTNPSKVLRLGESHSPTRPDADTLRFSPGYYHKPGPTSPVTSGPLWQNVAVSEQVPLTSGIPTYARCSDSGEVWPLVYEKAFAKWRTGVTNDRPDYSSLNGGWCVGATSCLVGRDWHEDWWDNESVDADEVVSLLRRHTRGGRTIHPMTAWTYSSSESLPDDGFARNYDRSNIVYNHCYALLGWASHNGETYVVLRNPWGYHEATRGDLLEVVSVFGQALNTDGRFGLPVEVFRRYFEGFGVVHP